LIGHVRAGLAFLKKLLPPTFNPKGARAPCTRP